MKQYLSDSRTYNEFSLNNYFFEIIYCQVYYDVEDGYDTLIATYKKARAAMPSITFQYVKQWMSKQKLRQGKPLRVWNSYVSPGPKHQYAVDIADMQKIADKSDRYKYLLLCIDTFTKYGHGIPIRSKDANERNIQKNGYM